MGAQTKQKTYGAVKVLVVCRLAQVCLQVSNFALELVLLAEQSMNVVHRYFIRKERDGVRAKYEFFLASWTTHTEKRDNRKYKSDPQWRSNPPHLSCILFMHFFLRPGSDTVPLSVPNKTTKKTYISAGSELHFGDTHSTWEQSRPDSRTQPGCFVVASAQTQYGSLSSRHRSRVREEASCRRMSL